MLDEDLSRMGKGYSATPAVKEFDAQAGLETLDRLADSRLTNVDSLGCARESLCLGHRYNVLDVS
jgi:hypothetical protein